MGKELQNKKTKTIYEEISKPDFNLRKCSNILYLSKVNAKCIIMARYGMLMCAKNIKCLYKTDQCKNCNAIDDESHRLNFCKQYININRVLHDDKVDFEGVYSENANILSKVAKEIQQVWSLTYGNNLMQNH